MFQRICSVLVFILCISLHTPLHAQQTPYSPQNPPPASLMFAGPAAEPASSGEMTIRFKFIAIIHSLAPDRIQIIDSATGKVLIDDSSVKLLPSSLKHPSNPSIPIYEWEALTAPETITEQSPSWLHESGNTSVELELRLISSGTLAFSFKQPATYGAAAKLAILQAVAYNKQLPANGR